MDIFAALQPLTFFSGVTLTAPGVDAVVALILAGILLLASAFVSGSEIALFSLTSTDMEEMDEDNTDVVTWLKQKLHYDEGKAAEFIRRMEGGNV